MFPLLRRKKKIPHVDLTQSPIDDLPKIWNCGLVEDHIVSMPPNTSEH
jgi:hypothetical protein